VLSKIADICEERRKKEVELVEPTGAQLQRMQETVLLYKKKKKSTWSDY